MTRGSGTVCSIDKFNEYCGIFEEEDFGLSAINFFRTIGHTLTNKPYLVAEDISYCIYFKLGFNHTFTQQEIESFSCIKQFSLLFQLDDDIFDKATHRVIKYYAIELYVQKSDRSQIAHIIHNAFSRESEFCVVIIFRNYEECMISISYGKDIDGNKIYLSDWISINSNINYINKIDVYNLSFKSSLSFLSDFIYYSSREYYTYVPSTEYIYNEISNFGFLVVDYKLDKDAIDEFIYGILNYHIKLYGDDYVAIDELEGLQIDDDFDFDLFEFDMELEFNEKNEYGEEYDDDYDDECDDSLKDESDSEQIDINNIDENILKDPVKLIKWLEKYIDEN